VSLWLDSSPLKVQATVPNRLFGPVDARDRAKACRFEDDDAAARNIRVYPSYVVNIGRIRRDVNPGPNAVFPERSGKFGRAIPHQRREAGGDGESGPPPSLRGCSRTISCVPQQNQRKLMTDPTAEIPPELFARLARPTVRLSGSIDEAAAASFLSQVLPTLDVPGSIVVELFSSGGEAELGRTSSPPNCRIRASSECELAHIFRRMWRSRHCRRPKTCTRAEVSIEPNAT